MSPALPSKEENNSHHGLLGSGRLQNPRLVWLKHTGLTPQNPQNLKVLGNISENEWWTLRQVKWACISFCGYQSSEIQPWIFTKKCNVVNRTWSAGDAHFIGVFITRSDWTPQFQKSLNTNETLQGLPLNLPCIEFYRFCEPMRCISISIVHWL